MGDRLLNPGDTISTGDPTLVGVEREIADLCSAAASAVGKVVAAFAVSSIRRLGGPAVQTALFSALVAEAAEQLAMGVVVTGTDPKEALHQACEALRVNFEMRLQECRENFVQYVAEEAEEATKQ